MLSGNGYSPEGQGSSGLPQLFVSRNPLSIQCLLFRKVVNTSVRLLALHRAQRGDDVRRRTHTSGSEGCARPQVRPVRVIGGDRGLSNRRRHVVDLGDIRVARRRRVAG